MTDKSPEEISDKVAAAEFPGNDVIRPASVGATLREARERIGLSVADVSSSIKFAPRQIEALEADDYARLPETAFVRGFVRSYARLLNLEPATLLAALPRPEKQVMSPEAARPSSAVPFPSAYSERKPNIVWLVAALIVAVALALSAWIISSSPPETDRQPAGLSAPDNVTVQPVELPVLATAPETGAAFGTESASESASVSQTELATSRNNAGSAPGMIRMVFDRDSWVEASDRNGNLLMSKINLRGSELNLNGTPPFSLVIGEARSVHLYYMGREINLAPYTKIEVARLSLE